MSRPSDPVGTVSISTAFWFLPRRMIEPLPNARSICDRAASSALVLSTLVPSTRRRLGWLITIVLLSRAASDPQPRFLQPPGWRHYVHGLFAGASSFFVLVWGIWKGDFEHTSDLRRSGVASPFPLQRPRLLSDMVIKANRE